jgi:hypothetical protein
MLSHPVTIHRMAKSPPNSAEGLYPDEKLKRNFDAIGREIQNAHIQYKLFSDLRKNIKGYHREFNNSPAFWGVTIRALQMGAISSLCRVYDPDSQGANLRQLLSKLRNINMTPCGDQNPLTTKQILRDEKKVDRHDPLVKKLLWQRDNIYAHRKLKNVQKGTICPESYTLSGDELPRLLRRAKWIINRYGQIYLRNTWSMDIVGHDDYLYVLRALKKWRQDYVRELEKEIASYDNK